MGWACDVGGASAERPDGALTIGTACHDHCHRPFRCSRCCSDIPWVAFISALRFASDELCLIS